MICGTVGIRVPTYMMLGQDPILIFKNPRTARQRRES